MVVVDFGIKKRDIVGCGRERGRVTTNRITDRLPE